MSLLKLPSSIEGRLPADINDVPWTRALAAGSLVASAALMLTGRRKSGIAVAVAGAAVALMEEPELVKKWWDSIPDYTRTAQDLLQRVEGYVGDITEQGERLRRIVRKA